jgi:hypothetical protein
MGERPGARAIRLALENDGYFVWRQAVDRVLCKAVLDAIGNDIGIWVDQPSTWDRVSSQIDQVPLWGHQSQWDIRQLPQLHDLWSTIWGTSKLWADRNSCRFTPPCEDGRAGPLRIHWDADPWDHEQLWYQGILALTPAPLSAGGFCCTPNVMHNRDRWPQTWTTTDHGIEYWPEVRDEEIVEVPVGAGDLIVFSSRLPHGTVRNNSNHPRAVFYLQMFPEGTPEEAASNIAGHAAGVAPAWWRWKPGHDRAEPWPPATLNLHGQRLLGLEPWP